MDDEGEEQDGWRQESVAAVAGELDFMAGFWREGGGMLQPARQCGAC